MPRVLQQSWISAFQKKMEDTEVPENFVWWSAVAIIGAMLKRNVWVWERFQVVPNQYIVLTGPPGVGKGSAMWPGIDIAKETKLLSIFADRVTAEKVIELLAVGGAQVPRFNPATGLTTMVADSTGLVVAPELAAFMKSGDWMFEFLCQMWDQKTYDYKLKNGTSYEIKDLSVSLLAGCVPSYLADVSKRGGVTGGFTSRVIFPYAEKPRKIINDQWGEPSKAAQQLDLDLIQDLVSISNLQGGMTVADEAKQYWKNTVTMQFTIPKLEDYDTDALANFNARIRTHILKTAIALSVSESDDLVIKKHHLEESVREVCKIRDSINLTFRNVGTSDLAPLQEKAKIIIERRGRITHNQLLALMHRDCNSEQLSRVLDILYKIEFAEYCEDRNGKSWIQYLPQKPIIGVP